jgi:hypothetical protein
MPKSTATCNSIINLMYRATAWADVAENDTSAPITNTYVSLHTANLTAGTNQQTDNETAYTDYDRVAVLRSSGWDAASGGATANAATISFPQCGASGATLTHVAVGTADYPSAGTVWHYGSLNANLVVSSGITPQFAAGALTITEA